MRVASFLSESRRSRDHIRSEASKLSEGSRGEITARILGRLRTFHDLPTGWRVKSHSEDANVFRLLTILSGEWSLQMNNATASPCVLDVTGMVFD
jgi:hypothetical protein